MRSCGGEPVVTWRSLAPFSTIALRSWCRFAIRSSVPARRLELVRRGVAHRLGERRHAELHLRERRHAERAEAEADRLLLQLGGGAALDDELLQRIPQRHHLVHRHAPLVAAVVAGLAAPRSERLEGPDLLGGEPGVDERLLLQLHRLLALLAEPAAEALRHDGVQ